MRETDLNKFEFILALEQTFRGHKRAIELRSNVVDNPTFLADNYLVLPKDLKKNLSLLLASWFVPKEFGIILREEIREKRLNSFSLLDKTLIEIFLKDKATLLEFLFTSKLWSTRDFFGNFTKMAKEELNRLQFRRVNTKVVKPQRKRGYHDHGSVVQAHKWLPKHDWTFTMEQNEIEEERQTHEDTLNLIFGFLE